MREAGATFEEKAKNACSRCNRCNGNFPVNPDERRIENAEATPEEIEEVVFAVEQLIDEQNAGEKIDWNIADAELYPLVELWRKLEKDLKQRQDLNLIRLLEHQNEILKAGLQVKVK